MRIKYSRQLKKQYLKSPEKIKRAFKNRRNLFFQNPHNPILNNHFLVVRLRGYSSINVTGDWRVIFSSDEDNLVIFEAIGTHSQLYR